MDIGAGSWPFPNAVPIDIDDDIYNLEGGYDYIFSSHCLEHIENPVKALEYWKPLAKVLFLYLPHPDMEYWLPQNCRKHLHSWAPKEMVKLLSDLGYVDILYSERDLNWSFAVVARSDY